MAQMPQPLMGGDKAFHVASARPIRGQTRANQQQLQNMEEALSNLAITLITSVMEGDQDFVRQASTVSRRSTQARFDAAGVGGG